VHGREIALNAPRAEFDARSGRMPTLEFRIAKYRAISERNKYYSVFYGVVLQLIQTCWLLHTSSQAKTFDHRFE